MKYLMIAVWAALAAETVNASVPFAEPVAEPSSVVMFVLGICAVGVGVAGRIGRRRRS